MRHPKELSVILPVRYQ